MRKLTFFRDQVENGPAAHNQDLRSRIHAAASASFARHGIEHALLTGVVDFPWEDLSNGSPTMNLADWTPVGRPGEDLERIRAVLREHMMHLRAVSIRGQLVSFPHGLLAAEINLNGQLLSGAAETLGYVLSIDTALTSLSLRCLDCFQYFWTCKALI